MSRTRIWKSAAIASSRFVRYADDCNIYVRSRRAGERVMASVTRFLARRLKLKVNADKSAVDRPAVRNLPGLRLHRRAGGQAAHRAAGARPVQGTGPGDDAPYQERQPPRPVTELSRYLVGWRGDFGFCETPSVLRRLDQWVRRRLRVIVWRRWKRGRTRCAALRRLAINQHLAATTAGSAHGPWRISNSPALSYALPNAFFDRLGIASLRCRPAA